MRICSIGPVRHLSPATLIGLCCLFAFSAAVTAEDAADDSPSELAPSASALSYGEDPRQVIDLWLPEGVTNPPLVIYVHGGAWRLGDRSRVAAKPAWALAAGWAFASVEYRLTPQVQHPAHVQDVAAAVAWLQGQAEQFGVDGQRIALLGHSAGAHLVTMVGVNAPLRRAAGINDPGLRAVIGIDGAGYDIPAIMADANPRARRIYSEAFGEDPAGWLAASPTHAIQPEQYHPQFLLFWVAHRAAAGAASEAFAQRIVDVGGQAQAVAIANTSHAEINRSFGQAEAQTTAVATAFLQGALNPPAAPPEDGSDTE